MKLAILFFIIMSSVGCATTAKVLQGMGDGLRRSSQAPQQTSVNCTTTGGTGLYTTSCM